MSECLENSVYRKAVELNENFEKLFEDVGKLEFIVNSSV